MQRLTKHIFLVKYVIIYCYICLQHRSGERGELGRGDRKWIGEKGEAGEGFKKKGTLGKGW